MQAVKMVITGPFSAGKTAFISAVSEKKSRERELFISAKALL